MYELHTPDGTTRYATRAAALAAFYSASAGKPDVCVIDTPLPYGGCVAAAWGWRIAVQYTPAGM